MKKYAFLVSLFFMVNAAFAQSTITSASVNFRVKNLGVYTEGSFGGLKGNILFDPTQMDSGTIEASIDVNTVNTDNETRDGHIKGEKFFNAGQYPLITMRSVSFKRKNGSTYLGKFNLTVKGITKPVDLPFTYTEANGKAEFNGNFKLNRRDFNVGSNSLVLADEVTVYVKATVTK